ncbi:MAG: PIG-L family deacetylase [Bacteroidetes bacterium]|nr:PIG-L family deacetylase [Bacteroidota bacterium]
MKRLLISLSLSLSLSVSLAFGQSSSILHRIDKLNHVTRVLYIAAHPDDENTRLIAWLTNDQMVDVSYLSITRGDGGQNLIGTEIGDELGLIRTHELMAARRVDGGHQYFTSAVDFGYSKTPEETLRIWNQEKVLQDMVRVIRHVKPDIIITRFSPEITPGRSTHGHHTASAKLALIASQYAADPSKYPSTEYPVHRTKKIFWNTSWWFYGSEEKMDEAVAQNPSRYIKLDVNSYLPLLGSTCSEISATSRSQHKSQGFGSSPEVGPQLELLELLQGDHTGSNLFNGIPTTLSETTYGKKVAKCIAHIQKKFDPTAPDKSVNDLLELMEQFRILGTNPDLKSLADAKMEETRQVIADCLGIRAKLLASQLRFYQGERIPIQIEITSNAPNTSVSLRRLEYHPKVDAFNSLNHDLSRVYTHKDTIESGSFTKTAPYWLQLNKTLGSYTWPEDYANEPGLPFNHYPHNAWLSFDVNGTYFQLMVPVLYGHTDPVKGEIRQPIAVTPEVMLNLDREVYVFATSAPKTIGVEHITGNTAVTGTLRLLVPDGWKTSPESYTVSGSFSGQKQLFEFTVTPPADQQSASVQAVFISTDTQQFDQGFHEIAYDHIPYRLTFPLASAAIRRIDLQKRGEHIGYLMGAGDKVPEALKEMGYRVTMITTNDIMQDSLKYDAIVIGIRAFNVLDDIGNIHTRLMNYVQGGGNVVVQYNTSHRLKTTDIGPYPISVSRERVTEEDAEVVFLKRDHPVLKQPNSISTVDFDGWVQERGLYFPDTWDEHYDAVFSMHDNGEDPLSGSLLIGQYGSGYFVYTGISFFRELPAGVPGAYRLLANLISLGK